jgi:uridine kinase
MNHACSPRRVDDAASSLRLALRTVAHAICAAAPGVRPRALLVALSGIDGSGKSSLAIRLAARLETQGLRVALIGIDPWQHPQTVRFGSKDPGRHFYAHAIRFEALFAELLQPLAASRSIHLQTPGIRTARDVYEPLEYRFDDVDVVLLEGILLLQPRFAPCYDLTLWVECSFATALRRALARNVERLPVARLRSDYARIYHAAQRHHLLADEPRQRADYIIPNDLDLTASDHA